MSYPTPERQATDADTARAVRRRTMPVLLDRARHGVLTLQEGELLVQYVDAEQRLSDQLRAGRETWKAKAEEIERDRDNFAEELTREQAASAGLARKICEQREFLARVRGQLAEAQAAIESVRALHQPMRRGPFTICARCSGWDGVWRCQGVVTDFPCPTVRALDGTEQPTTEQQPTATIPDSLNSPALHRCIAPAGHYDESDEPVHTGPDRSPGGWHTDGEWHVWSDRAASATPHREQPTTKES